MGGRRVGAGRATGVPFGAVTSGVLGAPTCTTSRSSDLMPGHHYGVPKL